MPVFYYGTGIAKERFQHFLDNPPEAIAIDFETPTTTERMPIGFAIAFSPDEAFYFQVHPEAPRELELLKPLLFNPKVCKIAHYALFDLAVMPLVPQLVGFDRSNLFDTNTAARLLGRELTALTILAPEVGMIAEDAKSFMQRFKVNNMLDAPPMEVAGKCQMDAKVAFALYIDYLPKIQSQYPEYFQVEMAVIPILIDLSLRGLAIDQQARADLEDRYEDEVEFYRKQIINYGVEKPGSAKQIGYVLADRGNFLPFTSKKKNRLSTRKGVLEFLDDPMAAAVLGWRARDKFLSTYIRPIAGDDRFYTEYYLDTVVGRLNSRNRNIQNIPPEARHIFLPDNGLFTTGDYAQEHLYLLMHFSQDKNMRRVYEDGYMDGDIHKFTASRMDITRKLAKTVNYSIINGATEKAISETAKIRDRRRCAGLLHDWFAVFRDAADYILDAQNTAVRTGWTLPTLFGRKIRVPEENDDAMRRKGSNYTLIGSDGEIMKRAIVMAHKRGLGPPVMAVTVHDSITWDGEVKDRIPKEELEMIPGFRIPFEIKETFKWE